MWIYLLIGFMCVSVCCGVLEEYTLIRDLLEKYDVNVRPTENISLPVVVNIGIALEKLLDVDDRNQVLNIRIWSTLTWTDHHLKWNPANYSGISIIHLRPDRVWIPDITLYSEVNFGRGFSLNRFLIRVKPDGHVRWVYPITYNSACALDMRYFPWDHQVCDLKFGSWTYDKTKVDMVNLTEVGDITYFSPDGEWELLGCPLRRNVVTYNSGAENTYVDVTYYVVLRRKVLYYAYNLLLPAVVITTTTLLVFYLPPESGEKVNLAITVLLALTVFLLTVSDTMPVQSDVIPLIGQYFGAQIMLMSLSTAMAVVVLNVHFRSILNLRVPPLMKTLVLRYLASALCMRNYVTAALSQQSRSNKAKEKITQYQIEDKSRFGEGPSTARPPSRLNGNSINITESFNTTNNVSQEVHNKQIMIYNEIYNKMKAIHDHFLRSNNPEDANSVEWVLVARVLDRFFLVGFFVGTVVLTTAILCRQSPPSNVDEMVQTFTKP